jgi:hypothetical protein
LVIKELDLMTAKVSAVPGSKEEVSRLPGGVKPTTTTVSSTSRNSQARIAVESDVNSVDDARKSAPNDTWDIDSYGEVALEGDQFEEELDAAGARLYRGVAARLNYMAPDRPDIAYAVKEAARNMSSPKVSDLRRLRKIGKYLLGQPRLVSEFKYQSMPSTITTFTDSDWAGCNRSAKSTSGGAVCLGEHVIKTYCKQQKVIALSSAEAELYAMVAATAETLALQAYAKDLGLDLDCELYCDSAAALGIAQRAGIGKVRHLRTQGLWVQEVRISGRVVYKKVLGEKNPADLLTKHMSAELSARHLETLNMKLSSGRAESAPTLDSLVQAWYTQSDKDIDESHRDTRHVSFSARVECRPIPAEGKGRRTPKRGVKVTDISGRDLYGCEQGTGPNSPSLAEPQIMNNDESIFGASGDRPRWSDSPSDDEDDWAKVERDLRNVWGRSVQPASTSREGTLPQRRSAGAPATDQFLSVCSLSVFEDHSVGAHSSFYSFENHPCQWLMDGGTKYEVSEPCTPGTGGFDRAMGSLRSTVLIAPPVHGAQASQEERWDVTHKSHHEARTCARVAQGKRTMSSVCECSAIGMHNSRSMDISASGTIRAYRYTCACAMGPFGLKAIAIENRRTTASK